MELILVTKTDERIEAILNTKLIRYEEENAILGIITDIRELKKVEHELVKQKDTAERYLNIRRNTTRIRCTRKNYPVKQERLRNSRLRRRRT